VWTRARSQAGTASQVLTLPTMLTLARVAAIPVLFAGALCPRCLLAARPKARADRLCAAVWFSGSPHAPLACSAVFVAAAATDFLDGYLARSMVRR